MGTGNANRLGTAHLTRKSNIPPTPKMEVIATTTPSIAEELVYKKPRTSRTNVVLIMAHPATSVLSNYHVPRAHLKRATALCRPPTTTTSTKSTPAILAIKKSLPTLTFSAAPSMSTTESVNPLAHSNRKGRTRLITQPTPKPEVILTTTRLLAQMSISTLSRGYQI